MLTEYTVSITKSEAAAILPVFDYVAKEMLPHTDFETVAAKFADYWRNRIAYAYKVPRISSIQFEIKADTWAVVDTAIESLERGTWYQKINDQHRTIRLGTVEREIIRSIRWDMYRQRTNNRKHLQPGHYKTMLHEEPHTSA